MRTIAALPSLLAGRSCPADTPGVARLVPDAPVAACGRLTPLVHRVLDRNPLAAGAAS